MRIKSKKGVIDIPIGVFILIFMLLIALGVWHDPTRGMLKKVGDQFKALADQFLWFLRQEEGLQKPEQAVPDKIGKAFNGLAAAFRNQSQDNNCLIPYNKFVKWERKYQIEIRSSTNGIILSIRDPDKRYLLPTTIENIVPCLVAPDGSKIHTKKYQEYPFLIINNYNDLDDPFQGHTLFTKNSFLYKIDNKHYCFFVTDNVEYNKIKYTNDFYNDERIIKTLKLCR